jgi:hypothetical protein
MDFPFDPFKTELPSSPADPKTESPTKQVT